MLVAQAPIELTCGMDIEAEPHYLPGRRMRTEKLWRELVGEQLRERRLERGETLREVVKRAGVSAQYLSEIERGIKEPSSEILAALAASMDTSLLELTSAVVTRLETSTASRGATLSLAA